MPIEAAQQLLHYRLIDKIGEGGMGVVWKALDTTLDREVAIKVLPEAFTADTERLSRFEREAKLLASLNHPNIASIYGLHEKPATEDEEPIRFLAMELIAGEDLSQHLERGPLPPTAAINVALQIAAALEAAHENGIIHRDLKPANVRFTAPSSGSTPIGISGTVNSIKVLDFGLAKALGETEDANQNLTHSPTITALSTQAGVILGTASYMSPEQARGQAADRRADIFSFGVVLYEMLTGERPFQGATVSDTLADILRAEPDLDALPDNTPVQVKRLLSRCLAKDPTQRLQAIGDARLELREALDAPETPAIATTTEARRANKTNGLTITLAILTLLSALGAIWGWTRPAAIPAETTRLTVALPPDEELQGAPAISRDGRQIAYVASKAAEPRRLYVRSLDAFEARAIPGTDHASQPFFAPDGRAVGFFAEGHLKVVELSGGSARTLAPAPSPFGASWADDDHIIFTTTINAGLMRIPAAGGEVENLTKPDMGAKGYAHTWPRALPGGQRIVFSIWGRAEGSSATHLLDRTTGEWTELVSESGGYPVDSGHLLTGWDHESEGDRAAVRVSQMPHGSTGPLSFDATALTRVFGNPWNEDMWLSVAANGTLAYAPGTVADRRLVWLDASGGMQAASESSDAYVSLALSPDGRRAVVKIGPHLWVDDLGAGTRIRLTSEGDNGGPLWDRDGRRVFFSSNRSGNWNLYVRSADGTGEEEELWDREFSQWAGTVAADGTVLVREVNPETGDDLWLLKPDGETVPFLVTPNNEEDFELSPDGRYLAYTSNESGRVEVYAVPFPGPGRRIPISRDGGHRPRWSPDGKQLYYIRGDTVLAATLDRGVELEVTGVRELFSGKFLTIYNWTWDVAPDGRFLMIHRGPDAVPDRINVVLNWANELERLASGN